MSECIAIYLRAPRIGEKARIFADVINRAGDKDETDFKPSAKELAPGEQCSFRIYTTTVGVAGIVVIAGPWIGDGCRVSQKFLLGDRGDTFSAQLGLHYDTTNRRPCTVLECSFDGNGLLRINDNVGSTVTIDTTFDAASCLYLAVAQSNAADHCTVKVEFRDNIFAEKSITY